MKSDIDSLFDVIESIKLAMVYMEGQTEASVASNGILQDAIVRRFEIMGRN